MRMTRQNKIHTARFRFDKMLEIMIDNKHRFCLWNIYNASKGYAQEICIQVWPDDTIKLPADIGGGVIVLVIEEERITLMYSF